MVSYFTSMKDLMLQVLIMRILLTFVCILVFQNYDSNFMATSLDEAYLDITEVCKERGLGGGDVCLLHFFRQLF